MEYTENHYDIAGDPTDDVSQRYWLSAAKGEKRISMAFIAAQDAKPRSLPAMSLYWKESFIQEMIAVRNTARRKRGIDKMELPYAELRASMNNLVPNLLRLESRIGLSYLNANRDAKQPVFALVGGDDARRRETEKALRECLFSWLNRLRDFVAEDRLGLEAIERVNHLISEGNAFRITEVGVHTLPWAHSNATHTSTFKGETEEANKFGYAALAEEAAIALTGHEILPGTGTLRRVYDTDPTRNQVTLLTPPVTVEGGEFSFCVRLHIETIPSLSQPLVFFDVSRRRWIQGPLKKRLGPKTIRGQAFVDALPDRALSFQVNRKERVNGEDTLEADDAFNYIAMTYGFALGVTSGRQLATRDYAGADQKATVRLVYSNGITEDKHALDVGVPEKDWLEAFRNAAGILEGIGLTPMESLTYIRPKSSDNPLVEYVKEAAILGNEEDGELDPVDEAPTDATSDARVDTTTDAPVTIETPEQEMLRKQEKKAQRDATKKSREQSRNVINEKTMIQALESLCMTSGLVPQTRYGMELAATKQAAKPAGKTVVQDKKEDPNEGRLLAAQAANRFSMRALCGEQSAILVVIHHENCWKEATLASDIAQVLFTDSLQIMPMKLSKEAHGAKEALPGASLKTDDRFQERMKAWEWATEKIRPLADTGNKVFCLVVAPEWYPGKDPANPRHDDPINKAAARLALITKAGAMCQYLKPLEQMSKKNPEPNFKDFNQRAQSALKDLLHAHSGSALPFDHLAKAYFAVAAVPQEVIGITVVRSQSGRVNKSDPSFVLTAFRLLHGSAHCEARFAYDKNGKLHITEWVAMHEAMADIASATPCWLSNESNERNRRTVNTQRYQEFVKTILDDAARRKSHALVFIDSSNAASLWPWLTDQEINPSAISMMKSYNNMQVNWSGLRIVRTRQQMAPLLVEDKVRTMHQHEGGAEIGRIDVPTSPTGLYKIGEAQSGPLAYWSIEGTGVHVKRGDSCYRNTRNTNSGPGGGKAAAYEDVIQRKPHINQWPTPNALEFVIGLMDPSDSPELVATFCHRMRHQLMHYESKTALPVPLFFEKVVRQYVARFAIEEETADESNDE